VLPKSNLFGIVFDLLVTNFHPPALSLLIFHRPYGRCWNVPGPCP